MKLFDNDTGQPWDFTPREVCMWDLHPYSTERLGIPVKTAHNVMHLKGNFCSFPCLRSFIKHRVGLCDHKMSTDVEKLQMSNIFKDKKQTNAPPRETLDIFEGNLNVVEFRNVSTVHVIEIPKEEISVIGVHHATCNDDIYGEKNFSRKPFSSNQATDAIMKKLAAPKKNIKEMPTILENFMCIQKRKLPYTHVVATKKSKVI